MKKEITTTSNYIDELKNCYQYKLIESFVFSKLIS
jgi:hypothetical protein